MRKTGTSAEAFAFPQQCEAKAQPWCRHSFRRSNQHTLSHWSHAVPLCLILSARTTQDDRDKAIKLWRPSSKTMTLSTNSSLLHRHLRHTPSEVFLAIFSGWYGPPCCFQCSASRTCLINTTNQQKMPENIKFICLTKVRECC